MSAPYSSHLWNKTTGLPSLLGRVTQTLFKVIILITIANILLELISCQSLFRMPFLCLHSFNPYLYTIDPHNHHVIAEITGTEQLKSLTRGTELGRGGDGV